MGKKKLYELDFYLTNEKSIGHVEKAENMEAVRLKYHSYMSENRVEALCDDLTVNFSYVTHFVVRKIDQK